jgi:hypothetical protein
LIHPAGMTEKLIDLIEQVNEPTPFAALLFNK